ncbi:hypothetical protein [Phenylobacterium zucineum]|uniref:hypothetical protein n=1 Tax=Phenylobacterium zucineum TaxID=284016 RepID=UPI0002F2657D|nr:hypothetical protein [Phenylobacterium zucineum]
MGEPVPGDRDTAPAGLNPDLRRTRDESFSDAQHGSEPMASVSVKGGRPAVWPVIWAVVTIGLILLTIWLIL